MYFHGGASGLSGFSEEQDIKWQADAIRRAIKEDHKNSELPELLASHFPQAFKRMKEDDAKEEPKIVVHKEESQNELMVHPTSIEIESSKSETVSICKRLIDVGKEKAFGLWNYLTLLIYSRANKLFT